MPFDGFGNFLRLYSWVVDATNSVKIRADRHDDEDNNFTAGLSNCITKDGQTAITQNIPLNSRRLVSVADPIDPQDAATKHYADTKMPLDGSVPITGDVVVKNADPSITLDGTAGSKNSIIGQKSDKNRWEIVLGNATAESTADAGSDFELINYHDDGTLIGDVLFGTRATGLLTVKANPTAALGIVTKQYVDAADALKMPLAGGTITGSLTVNGNLGVGGSVAAGSNVYYFGYVGNPNAYLQWTGGGNYVLSGGGTIYHTGNFNPATLGTVGDVRLVFVADDVSVNGSGMHEPYAGAVVTGLGFNLLALFARFRYLQVLKSGTWYTVGYA